MSRVKKTKGFTLMELLVVVAILLFVGTGIVSFLRNQMKSAAHTLQETPLHQKTRDALYNISKDLEKAAGHSIGSLVLNGGFELENGASPPIPLYWASQSTPANRWTYFYNSGGKDIVRSGECSLQLTSYSSDAQDPNFESAGVVNGAGGTDGYKILLKNGRACLVSAWVRTHPTGDPTVRGTVRLMNGSSLMAEATDDSTDNEWTLIRFRYPSTGFITGLPSSGLTAHIRLKVNRPSGQGSGSVLFDDISVNVYSALVSPYTPDTDFVLSSNESQAQSGFRFLMWEKTGANPSPQLALMRYRLDTNNTLLREKLGALVGSTWTVLESRPMASKVTGISFNTFLTDVNFDGTVDSSDASLVGNNRDSVTGLSEKDAAWNPLYDLDGDWDVDDDDAAIIQRKNPAASVSASVSTLPGVPGGIQITGVRIETTDKVFEKTVKARYNVQVYPPNP